jgi:hypothetical protein
MTVEISRAGPARLTALVDVLARSFADDPIVRWPFPTDGSVVEQCRELFRILDERFVHTGWLWGGRRRRRRDVGPAGRGRTLR